MREILLNCPVCREDSPIFVDQVKDPNSKIGESFSFYRCRACQLLFVADRPVFADIGRYYEGDYQPYLPNYHPLVERFLMWRTKKEIERLSRYVSIKNLLDIGTSSGEYLYRIKQQFSFSLFGVEPSRSMCDIARKQYGLVVYEGSLENFPRVPLPRFDVVVMNHVVEHLYNPVDALLSLKAKMSPGGLLFLRTPNESSFERRVFGDAWLAYDPPRHTMVFSPKTLSDVLDRAGFLVRDIRFEVLPNDYILSLKLLLERSRFFSSIAGYCNLSNPLLLSMFALPAFFAARLGYGSRMIVVAENKPLA